MAPASEHNGSQVIGTRERFYDALSDPTADDLLRHALEIVSTFRQEDEEIIFRNVQKEWAEVVCEQLDEIMEHRTIRKNYNVATSTLWLRIWPSGVLHAHQSWIINARLDWLSSGMTLDEVKSLWTWFGTTVKFDQAPYRGSWKESEGMIRLGRQRLPTVVFETGWPESRDRLRDDVNLSLVGGNGDVKAVLILIWSKVGTTDTVTGEVEYYALDRNGMPVLTEQHVIFPEPPQAQTQMLNLTRRILFGNAMATGANPNDVFSFDLNQLRDIARGRLAEMGLVPA